MRLHSANSGSGDLHIALIHGLGAGGSAWHPPLERILATGRYAVTTVNLRGHGSSELSRRRFDAKMATGVSPEVAFSPVPVAPPEAPDRTFAIIEDAL